MLKTVAAFCWGPSTQREGRKGPAPGFSVPGSRQAALVFSSWHVLKRVGRSRASQERPDDTSPSSGSGKQDLLFLLQLPRQ